MRDFRRLKVWEKAHRMTLAVYEATQTFPTEERYGLTSQARPSSASIAANIAEGCGRDGDRELARFLRIASGSASELEYHFLLARDLHLLDGQTYNRLDASVREVKQMLTAFVRTLQTNQPIRKPNPQSHNPDS